MTARTTLTFSCFGKKPKVNKEGGPSMFNCILILAWCPLDLISQLQLDADLAKSSSMSHYHFAQLRRYHSINFLPFNQPMTLTRSLNCSRRPGRSIGRFVEKRQAHFNLNLGRGRGVSNPSLKLIGSSHEAGCG